MQSYTLLWELAKYFQPFFKLSFEKIEDAFEACFSWIFNFDRN